MLRNIHSVANAMISTNRSMLRLSCMFHFLHVCIQTFGNEIEVASVASVTGMAVPEESQVYGRMLESAFIDTMTSARGFLGSSWTADQEQGHGQVPFESRSKVSRDSEKSCGDTLSGVFSILALSVDVCPVFMLHLPPETGVDPRNDTLLRRAVDASVSALCGENEQVVRRAMEFLVTLVSCWEC